MRKPYFIPALILSIAVLNAAFAQSPVASSKTMERENPSTTLKEDAERGWFFYERDKTSEPEVPTSEAPPKAEVPKQPKEDPCKKKETWTAECGFVDPGKDFDFQAKQRDALLQAMSMSKNDPKTVENFQYYLKWMMARSIEVANLWQYNVVQNPDLDPSVKAPISTFGLRLMTDVRDANAESIFKALKEEGAFLLYFSRYDCTFCHAMSSILTQLADSTGLEIWNASLDGKCMPSFEARCRASEQSIAAASALQVSIVPTLFLYVPAPKSESDTWIRISTGVTDSQTMRGRIVSFYTAYRTALLKGVANGGNGRAPVDFSEVNPSGIADGVTPAQKPGSEPTLPSEADIKRLLSQ